MTDLAKIPIAELDAIFRAATEEAAMRDNRNPDYPPSAMWDSCSHEWREMIDDMMEGAVECAKCGVPGQREKDGSVYWPAT